MNILANELQKLLEVGLSEEERSKRKEEFYKLYYSLRNRNENGLLGNLTLNQRKKLHKTVLLLFGIKNLIGGYSSSTIGNKRTSTNRPIIFTVTHIGKLDIEAVSYSIKD